MDSGQTAPKGSSLIWVHIVGSIGHKQTIRADDKCVTGGNRFKTPHYVF